MKALILNNQVVDVANSEFAVAESLTWMDCPDDCKAYRWSIIDGVLQENPEEEDTNWQPSTYAGKRKAKYRLLNQDEMRYDDIKNSTTTWVDAIDAIKAAHPKP